tara:strand:- start:4 stop:225 length:222 start_codon:yes stop_codon:yes gene_type:complete
MMPTKLVVNVSAGTEEYVEMTAEEIAQREADSAARQAEMEAEEAAAAKRAADKASGDAKLKELGLTDDEIAAR